MKKHIFKRLCALLLSLILVFSSSLTLFGCNAGGEDGEESIGNSSDAGKDNNTDKDDADTVPENEPKPDEDWKSKVIAFDFKDFERNTVDFDKIEYKRPDFDAVFSKTEAVISDIEKNEISFEEQIDSIESIEKDYIDIVTMRSLVNIYVAMDSSDSFWNEELSHIGSKYPLLLDLIEDMYVKAACSPHAQRFEKEYFGDGLIEKYKDGGKYSDAAVELLAKEEELENRYTTLSTSTVEITYGDKTDTVDNIIDFYENRYKEAKTQVESALCFAEYQVAMEKCNELYKVQSAKLENEIFIELIKVRRRIADEFGHESYAEYAYETLGHDYSYEEASEFIDDISEYIVPVYYMLSFTSLGKYLVESAPKPSKTELHELINNSYAALNAADEKYGDIYKYMLQHKLYDVELARPNRNHGSFQAYVNSNNSPFIFVTASGTVSDYSTLIHEFGHFSDAYINNNSPTSIDQNEISSQGLEYLMITKMDTVLKHNDHKYLTETAMLNALMTLILNGFYARCEELIYSLPLDRITREELDRQVILAAEEFSLNTNYFKDISSIFMTHTFIYPFYVQSYCVSLIPALEMFFMELESEGSGFDAYSELVDRTGENMTLEESLADAGLSSPFDDNTVYELALKIHAYLLNDSSKNTKKPENLNAA